MTIPFSMLAVHISNGILTPFWIWLGFAGMAILITIAMIGVRDEEVPRIALLSAAFFLGSSLHVRLGPASVHLLLNSLAGAVLGWRAALAIPVGLILQALLLEHGGLSTLGINSCILTIPAIICGGIVSLARQPNRGLKGDMIWLASLLIPVIVVHSVLFGSLQWFLNQDSVPRAPFFNMVWRLIFLIPSMIIGMLLQPGCFKIFLGFRNLPPFALGLIIGSIGVSLTLLLHVVVLLSGGEADWKVIVYAVIISHIPIIIIESLIVGFTIQFLSRVKPEYISGWNPLSASLNGDSIKAIQPPSKSVSSTTKIFLFAISSIFFISPVVQAHRLDADYVLLPNNIIRIETWFDSGSTPDTGNIKVFLPDNTLFLQGKLQNKGLFSFQWENPVTHRIIINTGDGHQKELTIPGDSIQKSLIKTANSNNSQTGKQGSLPPDLSELNDMGTSRKEGFQPVPLLAGLAFLLALAAFYLSWKNQQKLKNLEDSLKTLVNQFNKD